MKSYNFFLICIKYNRFHCELAPLATRGKNRNDTIPTFSAAVAPSGFADGGLCDLLALVAAESLTFGKATLRRRSKAKICKFKKLIVNTL